MRILGLSAFYHDSAACVIDNGRIVAAAQEERFTRIKHDSSFPGNAIEYVLDELGDRNVDAIIFYEKPITKFSRLLKSYIANAPLGRKSFLASMPVWLTTKLFQFAEIDNELTKNGLARNYELHFAEHHQSHASAAFYPSPFEESAVVAIDGVGEWTTTSIWHGNSNKITPVLEQIYPHSLGLLYSAFTYFCGFKVNSGEYKLMGLAPYGEPKYVRLIKEKLIDIKPDGSYRLNLEYFGFLTDLRMTNDAFSSLFGGPPRMPEDVITKREMDIAASIQVVTEEVVERISAYALMVTSSRNLCLAGGVALNCVANGRLLRHRVADNLWIQPASGDAGGALGAAYWMYFHKLDNERNPQPSDSMQGSYLGPSAADQTREFFSVRTYPREEFDNKEMLYRRIARLVDEGNVVGLFQGRMEFGPRALGNRSIIGDPRSDKMQSIMNLKIKYRESFRPFAPACLEEDVRVFFDLSTRSPYMLLTAPVEKNRCLDVPTFVGGDMISQVNQKRSDIPAVTHVDYSARIQTVTKESNPSFYAIIKEFKERTGQGILINTSFNVRGEPIVCTADDAYRCFMRTEMDYLMLEDCLLRKSEQPPWEEEGDWKREFELD